METPDINEERLNRELDALFVAYRAACPDPEPSPNFMPRVWKQIEARRSVTRSYWRWTQAFITAAAAISMLLGLLSAYLPSQSEFYNKTYVEALAEDTTVDVSPSLEVVLADTGGGILE